MREGGDAVRYHADAVRLGAAGKGGEGERIVLRQRILEGDGACQHAAVELGQHHMHGEVGRSETARALLPGGAPRGGDHNLQHRRIDAIERRSLAIASGGKRRGGDDHGGRKPHQRAANKVARLPVLQARDHERCRSQPARGERLAQRIDRRRVGSKQRGAIEDDRHHGAPRDKPGGELGQRHRALARHIGAHARERLRFRQSEI